MSVAIPECFQLDIQAFYDQCASHDWHFWALDDGAQYKRASEAHARLQAIASSHPEARKVYDAWDAYYHSGEAFGTLRHDKPAKPHALPQCEGQLSIYDVLEA